MRESPLLLSLLFGRRCRWTSIHLSPLFVSGSRLSGWRTRFPIATVRASLLPDKLIEPIDLNRIQTGHTCIIPELYIYASTSVQGSSSWCDQSKYLNGIIKRHETVEPRKLRSCTRGRPDSEKSAASRPCRPHQKLQEFGKFPRKLHRSSMDGTPPPAVAAVTNSGNCIGFLTLIMTMFT